MTVPILFHIPGALREFTGGHATVQLSVASETIADALAALWTVYPGVRDRVVNEQNQLRQHINIFVGNENIRYTGGLATKLKDDIEISIVPAVSGGSGSAGASPAVRDALAALWTVHPPS